MSETFSLSDYQIRIGNDDIVDRHLHDILNNELGNTDKQKKVEMVLNDAFKEIRVRVSTIMKTDNVSFLLGAGASLAAGGLSLARIPMALEVALLEKAGSEQMETEAPGWIILFYRIASILANQEISVEDRMSHFKPPDKNYYSPIEINLEAFLCHLHAWKSGMLHSTETLTLNGGSEITINRTDLNRLIKEIVNSLTVLLNLPNLDEPLQHHRKFIKKVLTRPLNLRRTNLFTLNYDTLIEQAGDAEGAVLVDGFVGTLRRIFRPESYDIDFYFPAQTTEGSVHRFDRALHLYKLHGSITWHRCEPDWGNPFGLYATFYNQNCNTDDVLIYPSPLKYGQTLGMPYSELFRRFGNTIAQPQSALFVIGYSFGDDHVNALIRQALAIPSFTLIVVDPNPISDFVSQLEKLEDERVWIVKGKKLGTFEHFVSKLLPDLREEEIETKVMKTIRELSSPSDNKKNGSEDENNGK